MRRTKRQPPEAEGSLQRERIARSRRGCFTVAGLADGEGEGSRPRRRHDAGFGKIPTALSEEERCRRLEAFRRPGQPEPSPVPAPIGRCPSCALYIEQLTGQGR